MISLNRAPHRSRTQIFSRLIRQGRNMCTARWIHNADARVLDRYVQSHKMVHATLLLLMLEAASADLVSPSA
jgi:hypothetical protein